MVYVYSAVRAGSEDAFGLVLPRADTAMMSLFFETFSAWLAPEVHTFLVMDKAGWHVTGWLRVRPNISLVHLLPYSPELNPVECVWLHLKERYLSHRIFIDVPAIVDACAKAWNDLVADKRRSPVSPTIQYQSHEVLTTPPA